MVKAVREGQTLVIFPEGRITVTGALMKVFDGPGMVADKADAPIVPVRIDGAQYSKFSRVKDKVHTQFFPAITLTVLPPRRFQIEGQMSARARRAIAGRRLYDEMSAMMFATSPIDRTLFRALLDARGLNGRKAAAVEDINRVPLTYGKLVVGALALGQPLAALSRPGEAVGLMLPNINGTVVAFFALQAAGRVPAMLNYTSGLASLSAACTAAEIRTVVTARAFVTQGKLEPLVAGLEAAGRRVVYLEDLAAGISTWAKLRAVIAADAAYRRRQPSPDAPGVILFTSGSEGVPKGVVLTHRNLLANCRQLGARIDFNPTDVVLNALPVFHSFGLTGGTLLPILNGIKVVLYPNPLHYRIVPALAYDSNATILFGTDTFLAGYARMAHPYDFYSVRYVFAGAERVKDETRRAFADKFGVRIFEGYGATEAAPVIAVNTPMHFKAGSVGRLLPGVEAQLDQVPGIDEGGRLSIRGPEHHGRLPQGRRAGRAPAAGGRVARHRRHRDAGRRGLCHDSRTGQALRQSGRRDGLATGGGGLCRRGVAGVRPCGGDAARRQEGRAAGAVHHRAERAGGRVAGLGARAWRGGDRGAARHPGGGGAAGPGDGQDRLRDDWEHGGGGEGGSLGNPPRKGRCRGATEGGGIQTPGRPSPPSRFAIHLPLAGRMQRRSVSFRAA